LPQKKPTVVSVPTYLPNSWITRDWFGPLTMNPNGRDTHTTASGMPTYTNSNCFITPP